MTTATTLTLEERVAALEAAVEELRQEKPAADHNRWIESAAGTVTDIKLLEELDEVIREYRRTGTMLDNGSGSVRGDGSPGPRVPPNWNAPRDG